MRNKMKKQHRYLTLQTDANQSRLAEKILHEYNDDLEYESHINSTNYARVPVPDEKEQSISTWTPNRL
jgi:hypothetical protein